MKRLLCLLTALALFACGCTSDSDTAKPTTTAALTTTTVETTVVTTTSTTTSTTTRKTTTSTAKTTAKTTVATTAKTTVATTTAPTTAAPAKVETSPLRWRQSAMSSLIRFHILGFEAYADHISETAEVYTFPVADWGTWMDWQTKDDFFYVMSETPDCYQIVVFDGENACVAQKAYIPEIPYRMKLANNALWVSFPHVRKIGVYPLAADNTINEDAYYELDVPSIAYPLVPVHYSETTAYTFDVYGDYIVYNTGTHIVRYNYKTGEAVPKKGKGDEYFYKHGVPESTDILIDPKLNAFYMSYKAGPLDTQLGIFDLETFALKDTTSLDNAATRLYLSQDILFACDRQYTPYLGFQTQQTPIYIHQQKGHIIYATDQFAITSKDWYYQDNGLKNSDITCYNGTTLANKSGDILHYRGAGSPKFPGEIIFLPCV